MTSILQRLISTGILMAWGSVLCGLYFTARLEAYLVPLFRPFTLVCGIALVILALLVLVAPAAEEGAAGCAPRSSLWKSLLGAGVLVVPLFIALGTSKDQFGASMVMNRNYVSDVTQIPTTAANSAAATDALPGEDPAATAGEEDTPKPPKNANGDVKAEVIDLLYAAQLPDMRSEFENKQVEMIGQLMPSKDNNPKGDRYDIVRMFMTCCAADVQPIAVPVHPTGKPPFPDMTWVKVTGKAIFPVEGGQHRPLIENAKVEKTDPPEDTYLY
jgi:uncharacterized repeat protein (TIGR03943 family)